MPCVGTIVRPAEVPFFLRLHGLWEGVIDLPPPPDPPFDIETFEPIALPGRPSANRSQTTMPSPVSTCASHPKASRNPPRRRFYPRPRLRLRPRRAPNPKLPLPKISKNKAWPSGEDRHAQQLPHERIHFIATADQPEISFPDARETPHSSFFIRISSFLRPSLPPDPLTPRRRSTFWPAPVRRARKQIPRSQLKPKYI